MHLEKALRIKVDHNVRDTDISISKTRHHRAEVHSELIEVKYSFQKGEIAKLYYDSYCAARITV